MKGVLSYLIIFFITFSAHSQSVPGFKVEHFHKDNSILTDNYIANISFSPNKELYLLGVDGNFFKFSRKKLTPWVYQKMAAKQYFDFEFAVGNAIYIQGYKSHGCLYRCDVSTGNCDSITFPKGKSAYDFVVNRKGILVTKTQKYPYSNFGGAYYIKNGKFYSIIDQSVLVNLIQPFPNGDLLVDAGDKGVIIMPMKEDGTYDKNNFKRIDKYDYDERVFLDNTGQIWKAYDKKKRLDKYNPASFDKWDKQAGYSGLLNGYWKNNTEASMAIKVGKYTLFSGRFSVQIAMYNDSTSAWSSHILPNWKKNNDHVRRMVLDPNDNSVWVATWGNGLYHLIPTDSIPVKKDTPKVSPPMITSYTILEDGKVGTFTPDPIRKFQTAHRFSVTHENLKLKVWDPRVEDGDTISVYVNGKCVIKEKELKKKKMEIDIRLRAGKNEILLFAHNLGKVPPNTATFSVLDGDRELKFPLSSNFKTCQRAIITYYPKPQRSKF